MSENITQGLNDAQVLESRQLHGANLLTPPRKTSLFKKFLIKLSDPLIIILIVAGVLSLGISFYEYYLEPTHGEPKSLTVFFEPLGIFIAIFLSTGLAFYFEQRAEREFAILNQVNDDEPVKVIRNGHNTEIPKRDVVVGDVVIINTGDDIPADGKLIEATNLTVDESSLTGEPACSKTTVKEDFDSEATYASDMVLRGTKVMEGHGVMIVEKVGDATENGKVFTESRIDNSVKTPLDEQLHRLSTLISKLSYIVAAIIIVGRCVQYCLGPAFDGIFTIGFSTNLLESVMVAVALLACTIPEGLPMAVTLALACSMRSMLKTNNLVRKLHACETMGATTVICTDKTGTLTQNQMRVSEACFFEGVPQDIINEGIAVNSTASLDLSEGAPKVLGNPTEGALLLYLHSLGKDYADIKSKAPVISELPFTTERKFMATIVESPITGKPILYVKGAPEIVLGRCDKVIGNVSKEEINSKLLGYQQQAMRTLGFAYAELDSTEDVITENALNAPHLTFYGLVAISDPVRADVPQAVKECLDAGINIKIVTGDTPATATEIGRQIGLVKPTDTDRCVITGPALAALTDEELHQRAPELKIIARARPGDKKRLVETLQAQNQVVAVTGDGTNDAPALKAAHVGLSMGDGTSVAKEASDITIIDNSFTSIGRAVMWGRSLYRNIQRFILFQLTVNVAACLIVLIGSFMGMESPLTVTQMLWVNLVMDTFAAMALASLPPSSTVMRDKPRDRRDFIISRPMWKNILGVGIGFFVVLIAIYYFFINNNITSLTGSWVPGGNGITPYEQSLFFSIFVFMQFWNMFNARAFMTGRSAFHFKGCMGFVSTAVIILIGQIIIVQIGGAFFKVTALNITDWLIIIAGTSLVVWIGEIWRLIRR